MTLQYEITLDDLVAFNLYHFDHSRAVLRNRWLSRYVVPVMLGLLIAVIDFPPPLILILSWILFTGLWIATWPWIERRITRKHVTRFLLEGQNKAMVGKHALKLLPNSIVETTEYGETTVGWAAVEKIIRADDVIYVYGSAVTAFVVPRRAFQTEEAFDEFFQTAEKLKR
ncbi:MAG: YcxB family protein [Desulfomonile tiedjei]|nr:YcxB family protein [Desulfomonile tiedjei]